MRAEEKQGRKKIKSPDLGDKKQDEVKGVGETTGNISSMETGKQSILGVERGEQQNKEAKAALSAWGTFRKGGLPHSVKKQLDLRGWSRKGGGLPWTRKHPLAPAGLEISSRSKGEAWPCAFQGRDTATAITR